MTFYKVLYEDGRAYHGGLGSWPLPQDGQPGEWTEPKRCIPCQSGYHVCAPSDLVHWLGPAIFEVEIRGETQRVNNKTVAEQARLLRRMGGWTETTARLFAVDCATRALNREKRAGRTPDPRLYTALKVARRFAKGEATPTELAAAEAAAWSAWSAAESAAESAWSAEWSAWSAAQSAWSAAQSAAESAWSATQKVAEAAAWSAAWSAESAESAWSAALKWQTKRLMEYVSGQRGA